MSHIIRRQQRNNVAWVELPLGNLESLHLQDPLPPPSEQLDQLILLVGDNQPSPSQSAELPEPVVSASIGAIIVRNAPNTGLSWLLEQGRAGLLVERHGQHPGLALLRLTMPGWERFQELKRGEVEGRRVLMAMKLGDAELNRVVEVCFRPAVKRAGFELSTILERQPAGLIDDQLRVALRTSRFVVADLTHGNQGAYWEAGFAEGLGRPVIYTCRQAQWRRHKTHFDTNHLVTVVWDPANLDRASENLAATIRATLPTEAKMTDDESPATP